LTTLIAWVGVDQRGPASVYLAADSRITWPGQATWDNGRKLFASYSQPDLLGYSGQAFFPTQALSQIVELIDRTLLFSQDTPPPERLALIVEALERSASTYPRRSDKDFDVLYSTRQGQGTASSFALSHIHFVGGRATEPISIGLPKTSSVLAVLGSGGATFEKSLAAWRLSDVGGTSRCVFSALADSLRARGDPFSGGPPQLAGLYRVGPGRTFGVVWEGQRFYCGMEVGKIGSEANVTWHNGLFEICDHGTLKRREGAQPQPRPRNLA
jgi:hypothetical protein